MDYVLGSGDLYLLVADTIPEDASFETDANKIGHISGGATLTYQSETYEVVDDYNAILGRIITKETVTFKSGILSWDLAVLNKLIASSAYTEAAEGSPAKLKIGGRSATGLQKVCVRFVHTLPSGNKLKVSMIATNDSGVELTFAKDKETVIDATFSALSQTDGTLVEITIEE